MAKNPRVKKQIAPPCEKNLPFINVLELTNMLAVAKAPGKRNEEVEKRDLSATSTLRPGSRRPNLPFLLKHIKRPDKVVKIWD